MSIETLKNRPNMYMGIGLWSKTRGLSRGVPVDVVQMLLAAKIAEVSQANIKSRLFILIADSMAIREGACPERVAQLATTYRISLLPFLKYLCIDSEIIFSSDLENSPHYQAIVDSIKAPSYMRFQTANTFYMHTYKDVGMKLGWLHSQSIAELKQATPSYQLNKWDELKFDRFFQETFPLSKIDYVYTKAGLRQQIKAGEVQFREAPPYTAVGDDQCYLLQTKGSVKITNRVRQQWEDIVPICIDLVSRGLVDPNILPSTCLRKNNVKRNVTLLLNHWLKCE